MAAILACALSYELIAAKIVKNKPDSVEHSFYGDWIKGYISEQYSKDNLVLIDKMNQLSVNYTEKQIQHLVDIFVSCSLYELKFWEMSWAQK